MRYITHSKYRNWSECDVRRILNCDIYRIYFLNAMYVASACGVLRARRRNHKAAICDETNNGMFSAKEEKGGERGRGGE